MTLEVDGRRVAPHWQRGQWLMFVLPEPGAATLRSRRWIAEHMMPECDDGRSLGVCVLGLWMGGRRVALDSPELAGGWNDVEHAEAGVQRWTDGRAILPYGNSVLLKLAEGARYWVEEAEPLRRMAS